MPKTTKLKGYAAQNQIMNGTDGDDLMWLYRTQHTNVRSFDGNDRIELYGPASYTVDAGKGSDLISVAGTGKVEADAGAGADTVIVSRMNEHEIDGGSGLDRLKFSGQTFTRGVEVNLKDGTAYLKGPGQNATMTFNGFEYIHGSAHDDGITGSDGKDRLFGENGDDLILGEGGNDFIYGGHGNDFLLGGEGNDYLVAGSGIDHLHGGAGNDRLYGGEGDKLIGGSGDDTIYANRDDAGPIPVHEKVTVNDGAGDDLVYGSHRYYGDYTFHEGEDTFRGTAGGEDHVFVHTDKDIDQFHAKGGHSTYEGGGDRLDYRFADGQVDINADLGWVTGDGAGGQTTIVDGNSSTTIIHKDIFSGFQSYIGSNFGDTFRGADDASVAEWFSGQKGEDTFFASQGEDHFNGGMHASNSNLEQKDDGSYNEVDYFGFGGRVTVDLNTGLGTVRDSATGQSWEHSYINIQGVVGSQYADTLIGDSADNRLEGGRGADWLTGGEGADVFVFDGTVFNNGFDNILDFDVEEDVIELIGVNRLGGAEFESFADLDTNGDGVLNNSDATMQTFLGDSLLMTADGHINLMNVTELTESNFVFG